MSTDYPPGMKPMSRLVEHLLIRQAKKRMSSNTTEYEENLTKLKRGWYDQEIERLKNARKCD